MLKNKKFFEYNFLPKRERIKRENKKFFLILFFDISLAILIIFIFFYFLNLKLTSTKSNTLKNLQEKYKKLKKKNILLNEKIKHYKKLISIYKKQKIIESINLTLLKNIEKYTLENLSLTNLKYKKNSFTLKGISSDPKYIYIFFNNLKKIYKLTGFQIKPSKKIYKFKAEFFMENLRAESLNL